LTHHELKPGGDNVRVNEENKEEYLRWVISNSKWFPFFVFINRIELAWI
jgi:hypothetical protein